MAVVSAAIMSWLALAMCNVAITINNDNVNINNRRSGVSMSAMASMAINLAMAA
jgi:hypothetical protein